jgi:thiamine biosynthesis lipoprotein
MTATRRLDASAAGRRVRLVRTMGTVLSMDVRGNAPGEDAQAALDAAEAVLHEADATFSTYRPDSWISRLARREVRPADLPRDVTEVFGLCAEVEHLTDGWFTARWRGDGGLDPTGLVKGWAAQRAGGVLRGRGMPDHCVNAAGDVALGGCPAGEPFWRVGVTDPRVPQTLLGIVAAGGGTGLTAVATSGTGERGAHIRDPRTGEPARSVLSATVVGPDLALADGVATALVAAGPSAPMLLERLRPHGWQGCLLSADGTVVDPDHLLDSGVLAAGAPP